MFRFLVGRRCGRVAIHFNQDESRWVILLLHDVKARDTRLSQALTSVCERGFFEGINRFRFNVDMNMNDEHARRIRETPTNLKPARSKKFPIGKHRRLPIRLSFFTQQIPHRCARNPETPSCFRNTHAGIIIDESVRRDCCKQSGAFLT